MSYRRFLFEGMAAAGLLFGLVWAAIVYPHLPATIAMHWNSSHQPTGYGPKSSLLGMFGVNLVVYIILSVAPLLPSSMINVPVQITPANRERVFALVYELLSAVKVPVVIICLGIEGATFATAQNENAAMFLTLVEFAAVSLLAIVAIYTVQMRRA